MEDWDINPIEEIAQSSKETSRHAMTIGNDLAELYKLVDFLQTNQLRLLEKIEKQTSWIAATNTGILAIACYILWKFYGMPLTGNFFN